MTKRFFLPIIIVLGIIMIIASIFTANLMKGLKELKYFKNTGFFQTMTVETTPLKKASWQQTIQTIGNLQAIQGTTISNQSPGVITKIYFKSGQIIKTGDLLLELDHADLSAQLSGAKATKHLDEINHKRNLILFKSNSISQSTLDQDITKLKNDQANIDQLQAQINYKMIRAPFSGKLGIREVSIGQYLAPGSAITTLNTVDPIYANFTLTQQDLSSVKPNQNINLTVSSYPKHIFTGKITSIDNQISNNTKGIKIQATIPNKNTNEILLPNMFANINITIGKPKTYFIVPENAIKYTLYGTSIYIADNKLTKFNHPTAKQIYIKILERKGNNIAIEAKDQKNNALKLGDKVISLGASKLTEDHQPIKIISHLK